MKYNIIENDKICYLDKFVCDKGNFLLNQIMNIDASIIVINDRKLYKNTPASCLTLYYEKPC